MDKPWKYWGGGKGKRVEFEEELGASTKNGPHHKTVTFSLRNRRLNARKEMYDESESDPRNLSISRNLQRQFRSKPSTRYVPDHIVGTETQASFINPGRDAPIPLPPRFPKVHVISKRSMRSNSIFEDPPQNAYDQVRELKSRLLAGENVSMDEIHAVRENVGRPQVNPRRIIIESSAANRRLKRKVVYCDKGIVVIPTPHHLHSGNNSFGSPADLRISLSNSNTPEFKDRRRYFYDFTGFLDKDIKLYLEGRRRLIIKGNRPIRGTKGASSQEEVVDLPRDLPVDNLRIVRDVFGTLIVEEAWKFG